MSRPRKLKLGFILHGVGRTWTDWRQGVTFRENLGLDFPVNRYTAERAARSAA